MTIVGPPLAACRFEVVRPCEAWRKRQPYTGNRTSAFHVSSLRFQVFSSFILISKLNLLEALGFAPLRVLRG
jgi:hypothetical protein